MSLQFLQSHVSKEPHTEAVWGIQWTAKDQVISIAADGRIKRWDSTSGQVISERPQHTLGLVSVSASPSGDSVLYNSIEGTTTLWDVTDGSVVGTHESYVVQNSHESADPAWSVSLHPSGRAYASTGGSGNVTIRSTDPGSFGSPLHKLESGRSKFGMIVSHSPDGARVALGTETGQIYLFDLTSNMLLQTFTSHAMIVRSLSWSADSQLLMSASDDKRLVLYDVRISPSGKIGGGPVATFSGHGSWVLSTAISPDSRLALSGSSDKSIKIWDIGARAAVSTYPDTGEVWSVAWRPQVVAGSAGSFVSGGQDGVVKWWRSAGSE